MRGILELLPIGSVERRALEQQGFVAEEYRHGRGPYFKLRYRVAGRQRVVYLGKDAELAEKIRRDLAQLQATERSDRVVARLTQEARGVLQTSKHRLEVELGRLGLRFHGYAIRRRRNSLTTSAAQDGPAGQ